MKSIAAALGIADMTLNARLLSFFVFPLQLHIILKLTPAPLYTEQCFHNVAALYALSREI